jgi:class 3 adenylate cyclase/tetratricopeptide (TPR) repeat protein
MADDSGLDCPRCRAHNRIDSRFCEECGAALFAICPSCGAEIVKHMRYCGACGAQNEWAGGPPSRSIDRNAPQVDSAIEGERKHITILFADLKASTALIEDRDSDEAQQLLDSIIERMIDAVHRYGGTTNQVMGDGIMALFGAPIAHEDHAVRACLAALAIHESMEQYGHGPQADMNFCPQVRVGLNSGEVILRSIRSDVRLEYSAQGLISHIAARMEQLAAPGATLMTGATFALVRGQVAARSCGDLPIKGLSTKISCWELMGRAPERTRLETSILMRGRSHFVGRDDELSKLRQIRDCAAAGPGQAVILVGDAGVGKSRLLAELTYLNDASDWITLVAQSASYASRTAYFAIGQLVRKIFNIETNDTAKKIRTKVEQNVSGLDGHPKDILVPLLWVLDVETDSNEWQSLDATIRRRKTIQALSSLFRRESERRPLMLVFEDVHWADLETERVIEALVDVLATARILLVLTHRPEREHRWTQGDACHELHIQPLSRESADEMLAHLIGQHESLAELKQQLIARTEGNPLFLEETVGSLIDSRKLVGRRGDYRFTDLVDNISIPGSVQAVVASRIDRLPLGAKRLLQAAAVIGKDIPLSLLESVVGTSNNRLQDNLRMLRELEFLYDKTSIEPEFTFKHFLTYEVAYASLLQGQRKRLHATVVEAIERNYGHRIGQHVESLAHHAIRGEVWDKAVHYLREAGTQSARRAAHQEALTFFNEALAALGKLPVDKWNIQQGIELHFSARNSLWPFSDHARIFYHLQEAEKLAQRVHDKRALGCVASFMVQHYRMDGSPDKALDCAERALALAKDLGDFELEVDTNFRAGLACLSLGDAKWATEFLRRNVGILDSGTKLYVRPGQPGEPSVLSRTWLAIALAELGEFDSAIEYGAQAVAAGEKINDIYSLVSGLFGYGAALLHRREVMRAGRALERAAALCHQYEIPVLRRLVASELGQAKILEANYVEAIPLLEEAAHLDKSSTMARLALFLARLGEAYLLAGRISDASDTCRDALELSQERNESGHEAWGWRLQAEILARDPAADAGDALKYYSMACARSEALGMRPLTALIRLGRSNVYRRMGLTSDAYQDSTVARRSLSDLKMQIAPESPAATQTEELTLDQAHSG